MEQHLGNLAVGDYDIYYQNWLPETSKAAILICHGIAEHSGRYHRFAEHFVSKGFAVYGFDHVGHGLSSGYRCHIPSQELVMQCIESMRKLIEEHLGETRIILLGHSMGGLMAAAYISRYQQHIAGCVLSGPAIASDAKPPEWVVTAIKGIAKVLPRLGLIKLDPQGVNSDQTEVEAYINDPLNLKNKIDTGTITTLDSTQHYALSQAAKVELPLLIQHGEQDPLTSPKGSQQYFEQLGSAQKTLITYPNMLHEIYNEPERLKVFDDLEHWLNDLLAA